MTKQQYEKISRPFRDEKNAKLLKLVNKLITALGYASYPLILAYLFFTDIYTLFWAVVIPSTGFVLLTFVRKAINRPRPYETLDIVPIIHKDTKGNSMPSRHVFSMSIIAVTGFLVNSMLGCILMLFAVLLAFIRVVGGVHYPADVVAGILCAVVWGGILYMVVL